MMKKVGSGLLIVLLLLSGCSAKEEIEEVEELIEVKEEVQEVKEESMTTFKLQIGEYTFSANAADTVAAKELIELLKQETITIEMEDYAGFEKVGSLGRSLTTSDVQTTTKAGDMVLYNGNNIVIFYGSNSWSYTRLGHIDDLSNWEKALGSGDVRVTLSVE